MRSGIATAAIDADLAGGIRTKRNKTRAQIVCRFELAVGDVLARRRVDGARNMSGAGFCRVTDIRGSRPSIEKPPLLGESRRFIGLNGRHMAGCQHDVAGLRRLSGNAIG